MVSASTAFRLLIRGAKGFAPALCAVLAACGADPGTRDDSLVALLANPSAYEGRVVTLRGYVNIGKNGDALYLHADDYRWGVTANAVWLHMPRCANRAGQGVGEGYMTVVGNFTARLHGGADQWVGEVDNIKLCRLIEGVDGDPRPRILER
jgi:hypothetical protein